MTDTQRPALEPLPQTLEHLEAICAFAYRHGFHELGYDPLDELRTRLNARTDTVTALAEALRAVVANSDALQKMGSPRRKRMEELYAQAVAALALLDTELKP